MKKVVAYTHPSSDQILSYLRQSHQSHCLMGMLGEASVDQLQNYTANLGLQPPTILNDPQSYHVTIRFWRGCDGFTPSVLNWLSSNQSLFQTVLLNPVRLEIFGEEHSLVLLVESFPLKSIFVEADQGLQAIGIPPSDYEEFKPHVSIAEEARQTRFPLPNFNLIVDRWVLVDGNEMPVWEFASGSVTKGGVIRGRRTNHSC